MYIKPSVSYLIIKTITSNIRNITGMANGINLILSTLNAFWNGFVITLYQGYTDC